MPPPTSRTPTWRSATGAGAVRREARGDVVLQARVEHDEHLVVGGDRDHEVGTLDARALEHPQLAGVAVLNGVLELLLDHQVATAVVLEERHLVPLLDELSGQVPADLAGPGDDHVHDRLLMST